MYNICINLHILTHSIERDTEEDWYISLSFDSLLYFITYYLINGYTKTMHSKTNTKFAYYKNKCDLIVINTVKNNLDWKYFPLTDY